MHRSWSSKCALIFLKVHSKTVFLQRDRLAVNVSTSYGMLSCPNSGIFPMVAEHDRCSTISGNWDSSDSQIPVLFSLLHRANISTDLLSQSNHGSRAEWRNNNFQPLETEAGTVRQKWAVVGMKDFFRWDLALQLRYIRDDQMKCQVLVPNVSNDLCLHSASVIQCPS